jgi:hypothetical protein
MKKQEQVTTQSNEKKDRPIRSRLPAFINDEEIGLGDVIKRVTYAVGIKPCGGCERRAATLNRWFAFPGRHPS